MLGLASLPLAFEVVCALPGPVVGQLVSLGVSLLGCGYDVVSVVCGCALDGRVAGQVGG